MPSRHADTITGAWSTPPTLRSQLHRRVLGWAAPLALLGQDLAVGEQVSAPDAPRLTPLEGTLEARLGHRAEGADGLGPGDVVDLLREEQADHRRRPVAA